MGRPRRGTEAERSALLLSAATRVFLCEGYGSASIEKIARQAGASTRTIYEQYKNKADLLVAVTTRLMVRDVNSVFATEQLKYLHPRQGLSAIGEALARRACDPEVAALFRLVATEAHRFPELAAKMRGSVKGRLVDGVANYLRDQVERRMLVLSDPARAAAVFIRMVTSELQECLLFGAAVDLIDLDFALDLQAVVDLFLSGAIPRPPHPKKGLVT